MSDAKWDSRFLELAEHVAGWSKDPSTKVGAVIVDGKRRVRGLGYNGFPRGVVDAPERYEDRQLKYPRVVHAEANAILNSVGSVEGCTLYVAPLPPCAECAKLIIQAGIRRAVFDDPNVTEFKNRPWGESAVIALEMFKEAGVETTALYE